MESLNTSVVSQSFVKQVLPCLSCVPEPLGTGDYQQRSQCSLCSLSMFLIAPWFGGADRKVKRNWQPTQWHITRKTKFRPDMDAHTSNPSYLGGRGKEDCSSRPAQAKAQGPTWKINKRARGVSEAVEHLPSKYRPSVQTPVRPKNQKYPRIQEEKGTSRAETEEAGLTENDRLWKRTADRRRERTGAVCGKWGGIWPG
jgi:hypothetical protein